MDFVTDIGFTIVIRILKEKRNLKKLRAAFLKLAHAILIAYEDDDAFETDLRDKLGVE